MMPAPDADERGAVAERVAPGCGVTEGGRVAHVPVDRETGKARGDRQAGAPREDDRLVAAPRKGAHNRAAQVSGAASEEHANARGIVPQLRYACTFTAVANVQSSAHRIGRLSLLRKPGRRQRR